MLFGCDSVLIEMQLHVNFSNGFLQDCNQSRTKNIFKTVIIQINLKGYLGKSRAIAVAVIGKAFYEPPQSSQTMNFSICKACKRGKHILN